MVGGHADALVYGDQDLLVTALRNLIDNAIRYSPENTKVGVGIRAKDGLVAVSVTDQGDGLSAEDQERVFERFYRVDAARSRQTGGTGLGLSIVKHVISNHGGEVTLWSRLGPGFHVHHSTSRDRRAGRRRRPRGGQARCPNFQSGPQTATT